MDKTVWRLLDANVNRAREGLRVVEDTARFVLKRPQAAQTLRALRHRLDRVVRRHYGLFLQHRDTATDSGRGNRGAAHKDGIRGLLAANFKRCEEALRVLAEYGRVMSPGAVRAAQTLRFEVYRWEKKLLQP